MANKYNSVAHGIVHTYVLVSQVSRIFPRAQARYGGGRGKGRKNTSGDYFKWECN